MDNPSADPCQMKEFIWRHLGFTMIVAAARYDGDDGIACVVAADCKGIHTLTDHTTELTWKSPRKEIDAWLLSKGYTPIW